MVWDWLGAGGDTKTVDGACLNENSISLFIDGHRVSKPLPLPEGLIGKERSGVLNFLVASPQVCNAKMI